MINVKYTKKYCENYTEIENYEKAIKDETQTWECHHRLEEVFTMKELLRAGWYYNVRPEALIFLTKSEHHKIKHAGVSSEETRKKHSEANKGRHISEETRKKISEANKGKCFSEEHKAKISESRKGRHISEETRKKMSESHKGENHPFYGKHHSEETKAKISEGNKGKHTSFRGENNPNYNHQARIDFQKCNNVKEFEALGYSKRLYCRIKNEQLEGDK
ncbi:MAG: hypothetical protein HUJ68_07675 [Clostridia bacterium]|nr:hypothetical protein [Clostridia bacterium]